MALMQGSLSVAVPLWIERLRGLSWEEKQKRVVDVPTLLGEKGDVMLFGGGEKGEAGEVFNRLAEGVAVLAFMPGGVNVFGCHFEAKEKM